MLKAKPSMSAVTSRMARCVARSRGSASVAGAGVGGLVGEAPDAGEVAVGGLGAGGGPFDVALGRAVGQDEPAGGVGAVAGDDVLGVDDVLLRLRHLGERADLDRSAVGEPGARLVADHLGGLAPDRAALGVAGRVGLVGDHALGEERVEGLDRLRRQVAGQLHRAGEEARVEQVQDRVLDAADVLVDVHPVVGLGQAGRRRGVRRGEAGEVPGRVDEGVHGVGLAPGGAAAGAGRWLRPRSGGARAGCRGGRSSRRRGGGPAGSRGPRARCRRPGSGSPGSGSPSSAGGESPSRAGGTW